MAASRRPLRSLTNRIAFLLWLAAWLGLAWMLLSPRPPLAAAVSDKLAHFAAYLVMTAAAASFASNRRALATAALATLALATLFELAQGLIPGRAFETGDLLANAGGTLTGYGLALALLGLLARQPAQGRRKAR